jgi:ribosome maturation factor RimP
VNSPAHGSRPTSRTETTLEGVSALIRDPLLVLGLDLEAVELTPAGKRRVLRIAVDTDGGPTMDDVAEATRAVSTLLDESDVMGELPYTLEVTSRGIDRPLTLPRHWRRNQDRLVSVTLKDGDQVTGRVQSCDDLGASLDVGGDLQPITYDNVSTAVVQIEFNRPTKESDV